MWEGVTEPAASSPASDSANGSASSLATQERQKIPFLGARKHARTLADEVRRMRSELERLGALDLAEIERRRGAVAREVAEQEARLVREREGTSAAPRV
jgi:hypothetical protein